MQVAARRGDAGMAERGLHEVNRSLTVGTVAGVGVLQPMRP